MAYCRLVLSIPLLFLFLPIKIVSFQLLPYNCTITQDTYSPNSTYHQNLKIILKNLSFAASTTHSSFYNSSYGQKKDRVYGLYLCRGDLNPMNCSQCIANLTQSITKNCPNSKESIKWDEKCMLRYANRNIFSKEEESPWYLGIRLILMSDPKSSASSPPPYFYSASPPQPPPSSVFDATKLLHDLINETSFGNNSLPTATRFFYTRRDDIRGGSNSLVLYSLAQCTPDITPSLCHDCLTQAYENIRSCCRGNTQISADLPSCQLRYDVEKFFDTGDPESSKTPSPPTGEYSIAIAISSVVALLLLSSCCFLMRKNIKPSSNSKQTKEGI